jgi:hypothetical protein
LGVGKVGPKVRDIYGICKGSINVVRAPASATASTAEGETVARTATTAAVIAAAAAAAAVDLTS